MIREESVRIPFRYAPGQAAEQFLTALRDEGRILGCRCPSCRRVLVPPKSFCPRCGDATADFQEVGPGGRLLSWTDVPSRGAFGLVLLDGAHTPMLHRLLGTSGGWSMDSRVQVRFAQERSGSILDIQGFEPEPEGSQT